MLDLPTVGIVCSFFYSKLKHAYVYLCFKYQMRDFGTTVRGTYVVWEHIYIDSIVVIPCFKAAA